jgi:hypothetical protein
MTEDGWRCVRRACVRARACVCVWCVCCKLLCVFLPCVLLACVRVRVRGACAACARSTRSNDAGRTTTGRHTTIATRSRPWVCRFLFVVAQRTAAPPLLLLPRPPGPPVAARPRLRAREMDVWDFSHDLALSALTSGGPGNDAASLWACLDDATPRSFCAGGALSGALSRALSAHGPEAEVAVEAVEAGAAGGGAEGGGGDEPPLALAKAAAAAARHEEAADGVQPGAASAMAWRCLGCAPQAAACERRVRTRGVAGGAAHASCSALNRPFPRDAPFPAEWMCPKRTARARGAAPRRQRPAGGGCACRAEKRPARGRGRRCCACGGHNATSPQGRRARSRFALHALPPDAPAAAAPRRAGARRRRRLRLRATGCSWAARG